MGKTNLYTIVTNDDFELPVLCNVRIGVAAEFFGCDENYVRRMVLRPLKKSKYKPIVSGRVTHEPLKSRIKYEISHDRTEYYQQYYQENKDRYHKRYIDKRKRKGRN